MTDPFDREFATKLQKSDREVRFDWSSMSQNVRGKAKQKIKQRRAQKWAIGVACVGAVMAVLTFQLLDQSSSASPGIDMVKNNTTATNDQTDSYLPLPADLTGPTLEQLAEQVAQAQKELDRLNEIQSAQQFAILKEIISRTEVNQQAIAAYHF